jgi:hypothetical protein
MDAKTSARFWAKVQKTDGCWYWTASLDGQGYGKFSPPPGGKWSYPHRIAYEETYGVLSEALTLDHDCHTRDSSCPGGKACLLPGCGLVSLGPV